MEEAPLEEKAGFDYQMLIDSGVTFLDAPHLRA